MRVLIVEVGGCEDFVVEGMVRGSRIGGRSFFGVSCIDFVSFRRIRRIEFEKGLEIGTFFFEGLMFE